MLIDRRGLFSGCRVYSALLSDSRTGEASEKRGRGAFRERAKEDYSDSFWLADFAFSNRPPYPSASVPVIRYSRWGENLEERGGEEMKACRMVAGIAITVNKILRFRGVKVTYAGHFVIVLNKKNRSISP